MKKLTYLVILFTLSIYSAEACTLVKITSEGKTIVGNNEDFSNPDTRIWFEQGKGTLYGVVYVGYNNLFPEGGMNEAGVMFDAFGLSDKPIKNSLGKKPIFERDLKRKIMQECSNIEQVKAMVNEYNIYFWSHSAWVFIDKTGKYLIVDGDTLITGDNNCFVHTNFRLSEITDESQINCWRYKKAMSLLHNKSETDMNYCAAIMDSVHQDGTLYTTIYDLSSGIFNLYYSHNYSKVITFNLKEELQKGDRVLRIPEMFPGETTTAYYGFIKLKSTIFSLTDPDTLTDSIRTGIINDLKQRGYIMHVIANYGYEFLHEKNISDAFRIFNLFIELFPDSHYGYDFLGEALMEDKQYQLALNNYEYSIKLDPGNINASQRIAALRELMSK